MLLKGPRTLKKLEKLQPRAFISYLIEYNLTNIFWIWNPERQDIIGYRDVIFSEDEYFNTYNKKDLIRDSVRDDSEVIKVLIPDPYIPKVNSDNEDFLKLLI